MKPLMILALGITLAGCGHMNDMLMGAAAGGAAGMGAPAPVSAWHDASWDAIQTQAAIDANTAAIRNLNGGY